MSAAPDESFPHDDEEIPVPPWGWISLLCYGPAAAVSLLILWSRDPGGLASLQAAVIGQQPLLGAVLGGISALAVIVLSRLLASRWSAARRMEATFTRLLGPLTARHCWILASTSAVGEELLFRAVLQPLWGLTATALLFGLLHLPFERSLLLWTPFAVAMGFLLGWQYEATGSLVTPLATHFLINWVNLLRVRRLAGSLAVPL